MSKIIEKRIIKIPPCHIDKKFLIESVGKIIEENFPEKEARIRYSIDSSSIEINSSNVMNFVSSKWPDRVDDISIQAGEYHQSPSIGLGFDFNSNSIRNLEIYGEDAIWVNGIADRLEREIQNNKLGHSSFIENRFLKLPAVIISIISISWFLSVILYPLSKYFKFQATQMDLFIVILAIGGMFGWMLMWAFLDWLFPRYEYGEKFIQKKIRKYILLFLGGSGIISYIFQKLLELSQ